MDNERAAVVVSPSAWLTFVASVFPIFRCFSSVARATTSGVSPISLEATPTPGGAQSASSMRIETCGFRTGRIGQSCGYQAWITVVKHDSQRMSDRCAR